MSIIIIIIIIMRNSNQMLHGYQTEREENYTVDHAHYPVQNVWWHEGWDAICLR